MPSRLQSLSVPRSRKGSAITCMSSCRRSDEGVGWEHIPSLPKTQNSWAMPGGGWVLWCDCFWSFLFLLHVVNYLGDSIKDQREAEEKISSKCFIFLGIICPKSCACLVDTGLYSATKHPYNSLQLGKLRHGAVKT